MTTKEITQTFQNPEGFWSRRAPFSIKLTGDLDLSWLPASAEINDKIVTVKIGSVHQSLGGIEFYSQGQSFRFPYSVIGEIRDDNGKLIWINTQL